MKNCSNSRVVWLTEERTFATVISDNAYYAKVYYTRGGIDYEVIVESDEFEYVNGEDDTGDDTEN